MTGAAAVLVELRGRGALVHLHNGRVRIEADAELPEHLVELARQHRDELLDELRREVEGAQIPVAAITLVQDVFGPKCRIVRQDDPLPDRLHEIKSRPPVSRLGGEMALDRRDWSGDDWLAVYLERAAVLEYVGGMSRRQAERIAITELGEQWAQHEIAMAAWEVKP